MFGTNGNVNKEERRVQENISVIANIVGKGTIITGDVETPGNIRIDGRLKGNIKCKQKVALGQGSLVEGNIYAQNAEIEGEVSGILEITDVLVLKPSAVVWGDIFTGKLVVESGAKFNGTCKMGESAKPMETKPLESIAKPTVKTPA